MRSRFRAVTATCILLVVATAAALSPNLHANARSAAKAAAVGIFEDHADVGKVLHPGTTEYNVSDKSYTLTGSGNNMWMTGDEFQFAWKKMSGDLAIGATINFYGVGGNAHRKAVLMIRQSLDADSVYVDAALHGNGLTALQYREEKGANTKDIESADFSTQTMRLEKRGDFFYLYAAGGSSDLHPVGASIRLPIKGDFYVGIGVCSHDKDVSETAIFSNLGISPLRPITPDDPSPALHSSLETLAITSDTRHVLYVAPEKFEAPNWSRDGKSLYFNRNGRILNMPIEGGPLRIIDTESAIAVQQRPRSLTRRRVARHQRQFQRKRQSRIRHLYRARDRRLAAPHHATLSVLLARLVARRTNARLHRPAQRRF